METSTLHECSTYIQYLDGLPYLGSLVFNQAVIIDDWLEFANLSSG